MKLHKYILLFGILLLLKPSLAMAKPIMQEGSNFRTKFGTNWETVLEDILKASKKAPCSVCRPASGITQGLSPIHKYFDDLDYYLTHFTNNKLDHWVLGKKVEGGLISAMENEGARNAIILETHQTLDYLKANNIHTKSNVQFGKQFHQGVNQSKQSDIYYEIAGEGMHIELKNIDFTNVTNLNYVNGRNSMHIINQVIGPKGAFSKITSLDKYPWVANLARNNDDLSHIKALWKKAFTDYNTIAFQTIWDNQALKQSLWKPSNYPNLTKTQAKIIFDGWVSTMDDVLFKFIK